MEGPSKQVKMGQGPEVVEIIGTLPAVAEGKPKRTTKADHYIPPTNDSAWDIPQYAPMFADVDTTRQGTIGPGIGARNGGECIKSYHLLNDRPVGTPRTFVGFAIEASQRPVREGDKIPITICYMGRFSAEYRAFDAKVPASVGSYIRFRDPAKDAVAMGDNGEIYPLMAVTGPSSLFTISDMKLDTWTDGAANAALFSTEEKNLLTAAAADNLFETMWAVVQADVANRDFDRAWRKMSQLSALTAGGLSAAQKQVASNKTFAKMIYHNYHRFFCEKKIVVVKGGSHKARIDLIVTT